MKFEHQLTITDKNETHENRDRFLDRIADFPEEEKMLINFAYDLSKESHRPQKRDSGERYFEHPRATTLILMDECQVRDPDLIAGMLLHDSVEDSAMFGNRSTPFSEWKKTSEFRLGRVFNDRVAHIILSLTKPKADGVEFKNKKEADNFYMDNLEKADADVVLLKMVDRLHNLRSLEKNTKEKQQKTVIETKEKYWQIFQGVLEKYPKEGAYLLSEMEKEMAKYDTI